jgi:response regulator NasT
MARVLVAEDEVLIRVDVVETLEEGGHAVVGEAGDGEQAVKLARDLNPDLVVMDATSSTPSRTSRPSSPTAR